MPSVSPAVDRQLDGPRDRLVEPGVEEPQAITRVVDDRRPYVRRSRSGRAAPRRCGLGCRAPCPTPARVPPALHGLACIELFERVRDVLRAVGDLPALVDAGSHPLADLGESVTQRSRPCGVDGPVEAGLGLQRGADERSPRLTQRERVDALSLRGSRDGECDPRSPCGCADAGRRDQRKSGNDRDCGHTTGEDDRER